MFSTARLQQHRPRILEAEKMRAKYILWLTVATLATLWLTLDPAAGLSNYKKDAHPGKENEISERREAIDPDRLSARADSDRRMTHR